MWRVWWRELFLPRGEGGRRLLHAIVMEYNSYFRRGMLEKRICIPID